MAMWVSIFIALNIMTFNIMESIAVILCPKRCLHSSQTCDAVTTSPSMPVPRSDAAKSKCYLHYLPQLYSFQDIQLHCLAVNHLFVYLKELMTAAQDHISVQQYSQ